MVEDLCACVSASSSLFGIISEPLPITRLIERLIVNTSCVVQSLLAFLAFCLFLVDGLAFCTGAWEENTAESRK